MDGGPRPIRLSARLIDTRPGHRSVRCGMRTLCDYVRFALSRGGGSDPVRCLTRGAPIGENATTQTPPDPLPTHRLQRSRFRARALLLDAAHLTVELASVPSCATTRSCQQ
jgi:hypothetical protein